MERVRHHTSPEGLRGIKQRGLIQRSRTGGVDVERAPFGPLYYFERFLLITASDDLSAAGRGAYVEFDLPDGMSIEDQPDFHFARRRRGATILLPETARCLELAGLNAAFVVWVRWYHRVLSWK